MEFVEAFAGISGIGIAGKTLGIVPSAYCEKEEFLAKVLKKHHPAVPVCRDIKDFSYQWFLDHGGVRRPALYAGGFPCQPYSNANMHRREDDERKLWPYMRDSIADFRSPFVLGENVKGFIADGLDVVSNDLEQLGYQTRTFLFPAHAVGAYHERARCFILAYSHSAFLSWWAESRNHEEERQESEDQLPHVLPSDLRLEVPRPEIYGNIDGLADRIHRHKAVGNMIMPAQAWYPLRAIKLTFQELLKSA